MADKSPNMDLKLADLSASAIVPDKFLDNKWKLFEHRYDYAWKYFEFHATQRTTVFNYFVVTSALFVNGYVVALRQSSIPMIDILMTMLALAGGIITLAFVFLDRRNEELVHIAEDVLEELERDVLFQGYHREIPYPRRRRWSGSMEIESHRRERPLGIFLRQYFDDEDPEIGRSKFSHGRWYPVVQTLMLVVFIVLALLPWIAKVLGLEPLVGATLQ